MPDYQQTVGTEALATSDPARNTPEEPRSLDRVRLVEERPDREKVTRCVAYVRNRHFVDLANELAALEAVAEGREKQAVVGPLCDDGEPFGGDRPELSGEYPGSHNLLTGAAARHTNVVLFAKRMLALFDEEAEKLCE